MTVKLHTSLFERLDRGEIELDGRPIATDRDLAQVLQFSKWHISRLRNRHIAPTFNLLGRLVYIFGPRAAAWVYSDNSDNSDNSETATAGRD